LSIAATYLPNHQALAIGIVTNELVTNALKYAFPGDSAGHVGISLSTSDGIELSVCDNGVGFRGETAPGGLGSRIVLLLAQQLDGSLTYERLQPGLRVALRTHPR
jgi:two-component sensor histidine kinase